MFTGPSGFLPCVTCIASQSRPDALPRKPTEAYASRPSARLPLSRKKKKNAEHQPLTATMENCVPTEAEADLKVDPVTVDDAEIFCCHPLCRELGRRRCHVFFRDPRAMLNLPPSAALKSCPICYVQPSNISEHEAASKARLSPKMSS